MSRNTDMIDLLTTDHREVDQIFQQLEGLSPGDHDQRRSLTEQAITELVRHSAAEESYLYPTTRNVVPGGDQIVDREVSEHAEAEQVMKQLEQTEVTDPGFRDQLKQLIGDIRQHVHEEETELFPLLRQHCDPDQLQDLGQKVTRMKQVAPTRPHPSAPTEGTAKKALAPGAGLVDRVRDTVSGRGGS